MNEQEVFLMSRFEEAKEAYAAVGVDVEAALKQLQ